MRLGIHTQNVCDRCGHYEWSHKGKGGCTVQVHTPDGPRTCPCPDTYIDGVFTRSPATDEQVWEKGKPA